MSDQTFSMLATTSQGLEEVLAKELYALGAKKVVIGKRSVAFEGDTELMYRANLCLRTALRILKPIATFRIRHESALYQRIQSIDWSKYMTVNQTLAIDGVTHSKYFKHSKYVALKTKDAIVDQFRDKYYKRPNINTYTPDLRLNIHINDETCTVSLDSSGATLNKRGYREETLEAPINEIIAAGIVLNSGWQCDCDLWDAMCGSGTILVEAAMYAYNIAPQKNREYFAFKRWESFDKALWDKVYQETIAAERPFNYQIKGFDLAFQAVRIAQRNIERAGLSDKIEVKRKAFDKNSPEVEKGFLLFNPPYGERLNDGDMLAFYKSIGDHLKHNYKGFTVWMISSNKAAIKSIGLRASRRIPIWNGALECRLLRYDMY